MQAPVTAQGWIRFGPFELDPRSGQLRNGSTELRLSDQPLAVLTALLERPGELVAREELVRRLWPQGTFVDFDHGLNSAISRLREVLDDSANVPRFVETIPRRGYRLLVPVEGLPSAREPVPVDSVTHAEPPPADDASKRAASVATDLADREPGEAWRVRSRGTVWMAVGATVLVAVCVAGVLTFGKGTRSTPPMRLLTVTSFPGSEGNSTFSPDGNFVAFTWTGPDFTGDADLWVKAVDGEALRRLTDTPHVNEVYPAWSPDGQRIAFVRVEGDYARGIYLISSLGGSEKKVSDSGVKPTWLPDSQSLVFEERLTGRVVPVHYVLATGARRPLTTPPSGFIDGLPAVSPDGKTVAFIRSTTAQARRPDNTTRAGLFVVPLAGGEPVRIDDRASGSAGAPAWTPDSREIFYPRWDINGVKVFRVAAAGGPPTPAVGLPMSPMGVAISGFRGDGTFRVAVTNAHSDAGLRMIDLRAAQASGRISAWTAFCDSTRIDWPGRFSLDGASVSFTSDRNGLPQILTARRDGSQVRTLTTLDGSAVGLASWSPDGQFLVFDAVGEKNRTDLYIVGADGGPLRRLTNDDGREVDADWSKDGRWIYYSSDTSGRPEIWKIPAAGGTPVQLTRGGGMDPRESPDGRSVLFLEPPSGNSFWVAATLKRVSVDGGSASTVLSGIRRGRWDVAETGIAFLTGAPGQAPDPATPDALEFYSFTDGRTRRIGELPFPVTSRGFSPPRVLIVSPDGQSAVVSHQDHWERDIVVADNFR